MPDYRQITNDLTGLFKRKALRRLTGIEAHTLDHLKTGYTKRPKDELKGDALEALHSTVKEKGWI